MATTKTVFKKRRKKLVEALRSGKYKQGFRALKTCEGEYCCLGVATELSRNDLGLGDWSNGNTYGREYQYILGESMKLPFVVKEYYNFRTSYGTFTPTEEIIKLLKKSLDKDYLIDDGEINLADLNDSGASFDLIADIIELNPPDLFTN